MENITVVEDVRGGMQGAEMGLRRRRDNMSNVLLLVQITTPAAAMLISHVLWVPHRMWHAWRGQLQLQGRNAG